MHACQSGSSAVVAACNDGNADVVNLLLEHDVQLDARNNVKEPASITSLLCDCIGRAYCVML